MMNYCAPAATLAETARGLHAGATAQIWLMSSISLGLSAALLAAGSLADDHGRKRTFVIGAAALAVSSVACALAPNAPVFIAGRIAQGAASAALLVTGLGILGASFEPGPRRARATGMWGAMVGLGIALGPIAAAGLTVAAGWRSWYWATVAAAVLLGAAAARGLGESRAERPRGLDVPGLVTMSLGVAALLAAITWGRTGWTAPGVLALFAAAAVLLAAFTLVEARRREPMVDLALFRRPAFLLSVSGALVTGLSVIGIMTYLATMMILVMGLSPVGAALVLAIWSALSFVVALQAHRLPARLPARRLLARRVRARRRQRARDGGPGARRALVAAGPRPGRRRRRQRRDQRDARPAGRGERPRRPREHGRGRQQHRPLHRRVAGRGDRRGHRDRVGARPVRAGARHERRAGRLGRRRSRLRGTGPGDPRAGLSGPAG
nr:MFS transporter [Actinomadura madurae]